MERPNPFRVPCEYSSVDFKLVEWEDPFEEPHLDRGICKVELAQ